MVASGVSYGEGKERAMNQRARRRWAMATSVALLATSVRVSPASAHPADNARVPLSLPWRAAGLSEREAAAHLLARLTFGARPGDVDRVVALGLERWVERQLAPPSPAPAGSALARDLAPLTALDRPQRELSATYPPPAALLRRAEREGVISRERAGEIVSAAGAPAAAEDRSARREERRKVEAWMEREGLRSERELLAQSYAQKLLRAVASEHQLHEVLADFWFNHFNVSITDNAVRGYLLTYERDAIRPHVLGRFRDLVGATAKHPAMLAYLDNFQSIANPGQPTLARGREEIEAARGGRGRAGMGGMRGTSRAGRGMPGGAPAAGTPPAKPPRPNRPQGLNENYARELLELHTLGVDGGYTQQDVVEVARAFTGWSFLPAGYVDREAGARLERARGSRRFAESGYVSEGDFLFRADAHDAAAKSVLGTKLPAGRGVEDGEAVLDLVAAHPSTARHLARKLAARFVADEPPPALVDRLAAELERTGGDLGSAMRVLLASPEFWDAAHRGQKIKSPFEVAVSALRALDADVDNPFPTVEWVSRMGQALYAYQAPTGFPDRADFWVNTGALLARMNFGLELAAGRIGGVRFDLAALNAHHEPESPSAALATYATLLLPERATAATVARLEPLLARPELAERVAERAPAAPESALPGDGSDAMDDFGALAGDMPARTGEPAGAAQRGRGPGEGGRRDWDRLGLYPPAQPMHASEPPTVVAGVVGLIVGSPEFQRR
jgi:uncharacterized protein (DUF1800 family)